MSLPNLLPPLSPEEYDSLRDSLAKHGWWPEYPAVKDDDGNTLVGWHRLTIAAELGIEPVVVVKTGMTDWEKVEYAVKGDVARRHLDAFARQQLLGRLMEVNDEILRKMGDEARKAGNAKGGSKSSLNETGLRAAAAEATKQTFNGPVTTSPRPKVDKLEEYGKMLGVSRATVARDKAALDRIERIDMAAEDQGRTDISKSLSKKGADLAGFEFELGLRPAPLAAAPLPSETDKTAGLDLLAAAFAALDYKTFDTDDARHVIEASGLSVGAIGVGLLNMVRAFREVEKNG